MESTPIADGERRMFWGLSLDSWNNLIVFFGVISGVFVVATGGATYIAFQLQKAEAHAADESFARYKLDTSKTISEANARANEAALELAKLKAPRDIGLTERAAIADLASRHKSTALDIFLLGDSPDIAPLSHILTYLVENNGNWSVKTWTWSGVSPIVGIAVVVKPGAKPESVAIANGLVRAISGDPKLEAEVWPGEWDKYGGLLNGPVFDPERSEIRVIIGLKPL